jgi:hypothetical protein
MRASDRKAFSELLTDALAFYGQATSKFAMDVWWQACQGFELEQVSKALTAHAMDPERGHFAPKPADIVRQLQGTQTDRSLLAWGKLLEAMQRVGAYTSVAFDDAAIHAAVEDLGGWQKICREPLNDLPHLQRRFCEAHRVHSRNPHLVYPPRLIGQHEGENRTKGKPVAQPVLIGDPRAAQRVMAGGSNAPRVPMAALGASIPGYIGRLVAEPEQEA